MKSLTKDLPPPDNLGNSIVFFFPAYSTVWRTMRLGYTPEHYDKRLLVMKYNPDRNEGVVHYQ